MKQIILGTAGHIDHGKTSLIRALTGVDTDRLKEEKLRGITIELGFAALDLPSGQHIGIVDVPGHEKFVKNMVAGATGIDLVTMVVAADEGIMPQTREHMEICTLLGIRHGLVVMTKVDMVDEEWLELVVDDIEQFTTGTFLESAPVLPVSSVSGQGIPELINALDDIAAGLPERSSAGIFRLPIDRVFTMKGFGTVITGTLTSGRVRLGERIMLYPSEITSKVRGIQVHNEAVEKAIAGQRTAINFQGLEKAAVERGQVLALPGSLKSSFMLDMDVHYLASNTKKLKNRTRLRFHSGTSEILGNLILLDRDELLPGDQTVAQIRLEKPLALLRGDRFVLRSYSPVRTIGGGQIINPIPPKHRRFRTDLVAQLERLADSPSEEMIAYHAIAAGYAGVSFADLKLMTNLGDKQLSTVLQGLMSSRRLLLMDKDAKLYIEQSVFGALREEIAAKIGSYHQANPLKPGILKEELRSKFPQTLNPKLFTLALNQMTKDDQLVQEEKTVRLSQHRIALGVDQAQVRQKIIDSYAQAKLTPPYFRELTKTLDMEAADARDVLQLLLEEGRLIKVKDDLYYDPGAIDALQRRLVDFLTAHGEITTPQFKDMTGASRKYVIPLIEYFDARNVTIRIGDIRKLRRG